MNSYMREYLALISPRRSRRVNSNLWWLINGNEEFTTSMRQDLKVFCTYLNTEALPKRLYLSSASPPLSSQSIVAKFTASPTLN
jgi:hypothetical protein